MIDILGYNRIVLLVGLLAGNILLACAAYLYLEPQNVEQARALSQVNSEVTTLRTDIARMQVEFDQLQIQKEDFQKLETDGFFKNQSRRNAQDVFNSIQKQSGVSLAIAKIDAGKTEENEEAKKAKYKLLMSPVDLKIEAVDDADIYHYLFLIEHYFPGHVSVESLNVKREADVTGTVLRGIASGASPALVKANVKMQWRTMIPEDQVIGDGEQR